ncbi:hypothetical protein [Maricaulis sp.]|uniref:ECs_2282 family putative zinc-binding protein n=1 Tax=Maricaulis sp. TaxID=1486257 RepID=UPI001B224249|nr:hypothetical protein [Maricaulis sp.]MBO6766242.1 hypothetical protein [Maricaulis sp.]
MKDNYNRSITLHCETCGGTDFRHDDEDDSSPVTCAGCDREYLRSELIELNYEHIEAEKQEMLSEIQKDVKDDIKKMFKRSKWISIK